MIDDLIKESEKKMKHSLDHLRLELGKVRTGRASLSLLEGIKVDYYGNPTPLNQVATLGTPDSHTIAIQPWDHSVIKIIEKAIQASDLGLSPSNDGKVVRLNIPPLTTERRQQMAKTVKKLAEECRVAIRNVRREANEKVKAQEKNHAISQDDHKRLQDRIQKATDQSIAEVDKIAQSKEKDLLEV
ncbi:MAG: ribosome recycling factor [Nitrospinae bacterium]|nr:ribosome recycling factor [Nitrospinota bacterium]